ncbi:histidine kinase [Actinomyces sp. ZJ308]|uniref:sensor histidine kinase n=1 Tax=Actinomyces sp. ZJ308 TaxID=2708342 RepID=UPI001422773C|nr:histidine kinase [Actinomyces sp. ZJ308]
MQLRFPLRWPGRATTTHEALASRRIAELTASRRAIVAAYEVERRRIERDLHDGAQQRLVVGLMKLGEAQISPAVAADPALASLLSEAKAAIAGGLDSLRTTVRGIHPRVLTELGLAEALREAVDRADGSGRTVRVVCPHPLPTMPEGVLAAGYFFALEAMTNALKHAPGAKVTILLTVDRSLRVCVVDTGPGGARLRPGHGLVGMRERLAAFGGELLLSSPPGGPTQVAAHLPLLLARGESGIGPDSPDTDNTDNGDGGNNAERQEL